MDNCTLDCILIQSNLNVTQMCTYTQAQCHQDTIQFVQGYYCLFRGSFMILIFLGVNIYHNQIPFFLLLFKTLNVIAQQYLSPSVEVFIQEFKISPILAGVTFLAFANGAPDVMTAIVAGSSDSNTTALIPFGSIFGALLFSAAFILSAVILFQKDQTIQIKLRQCVLPLGFYILFIVFIILVTVIYGKMNMYLAAFPILLYVIYIFLVLRSEKNSKAKERLLSSADSQYQIFTESSKSEVQVQNSKEQPEADSLFSKVNNKVNEIEISIFSYIIPFYKIDQWHPRKAIISLIISPLSIALTQEVPHIFEAFVGPIPVFLLICLPSILLLAYTIYCVVRGQQPYYMKVFTIYSFIISTSTLTVVCSILINFVQLVQLLTQINSVFLGLTVFAWANSIGDYLTITHFAKRGQTKTAIAGIFSGQLFNFLLGFGVSLFIQSIDGEYEYKIFDFKGQAYDKISDAIVMTVIVSGLIYLILLVVVALRNKGVLMKKEAVFARWYYIAFLLISCFLAVLTDFFREIECSL